MAQQHKTEKKPNFIRHHHPESKKGKKQMPVAVKKAQQQRKPVDNLTSDVVVARPSCAYGCSCVACLIAMADQDNEARIRKSTFRI